MPYSRISFLYFLDTSLFPSHDPALICGLGVVVSESVAVELDDKPFIRVIPERLINNDKYIRNALRDNREVSRKYRKEIREYGS